MSRFVHGVIPLVAYFLLNFYIMSYGGMAHNFCVCLKSDGLILLFWTKFLTTQNRKNFVHVTITKINPFLLLIGNNSTLNKIFVTYLLHFKISS